MIHVLVSILCVVRFYTLMNILFQLDNEIQEKLVFSEY